MSLIFKMSIKFNFKLEFCVERDIITAISGGYDSFDFSELGISYLFNSFSLFGCETNRSNCEWLVFPKSRGIRENGLENPYFGISRRRRRREIVKGFERPFSLIPSDLGETSFTVRKVCRTHPKREKWIEQITFLNFTSIFV